MKKNLPASLLHSLSAFVLLNSAHALSEENQAPGQMVMGLSYHQYSSADITTPGIGDTGFDVERSKLRLTSPLVQ